MYCQSHAQLYCTASTMHRLSCTADTMYICTALFCCSLVQPCTVVALYSLVLLQAVPPHTAVQYGREVEGPLTGARSLYDASMPSGASPLLHSGSVRRVPWPMAVAMPARSRVGSVGRLCLWRKSFQEQEV